jgi:pimeloyl-ACP methyl ester carboxylesterase
MEDVASTSDTRLPWLPFLAGVLAGGAGLVLVRALSPRPSLDPRLLKLDGDHPGVAPVVVVPGILGSELLRPDGTQVWLNAGNALGHHDLALPATLPLGSGRDGLVPGDLLGTDDVLPRLFGFTEYPDLVDLLRGAGLHYHVFTYDWRRDLAECAARLGERLDALAEDLGNPDTRFNLVGHSMGGLVARYYLRFGGAPLQDGAPVTWAGSRRIRSLALVAAPNTGSVPSLDAILNGSRVGLSFTTLAASVISTMPSIYQLLPPAGAPAMLDERLSPLAADLHDPATWERFGWGPFGNESRRRGTPAGEGPPDSRRAFVAAALERARLFHRALSRTPETRCPVRGGAMGGDCLPTLGHAIVSDTRGAFPRFEPRTRAEAAVMMEAGDGRVTRASVLASHLPEADASDVGAGIPEIESAFFGAADHHGIYGEATFQSVLLRILLRVARSRTARSAAV